MLLEEVFKCGDEKWMMASLTRAHARMDTHTHTQRVTAYTVPLIYDSYCWRVR